MRCVTLISMVLVMSCLVFSQQRYLVSPSGEVQPLTKQQSAVQELRKKMRPAGVAGVTQACSDKFTFGFTEDIFPGNNNFGAYHKDVLGQWYVAKASGTIDTIFWDALNVGALDSTVYVRIHNSNIGPAYGPGIRPGPYNPPCQNWGYWFNTNDLDQGVAAFIEEATDTTWNSTINNSPLPSGPPFQNEIWGLGGFPVTDHANTINHVAMMALGTPCSVKVGQKFFISMRVNDPNQHINVDTRTEWITAGFHVTNTDENYPSRNWKFYEHDSGPSNCAGVPIDLVKRGWVARGGFSADTLDVAAYNWWFVMTVSTNTPPLIESVTGGDVHNTLSEGPQHIIINITDCDAAHPESAGVASAVLKWSIGTIRPNPVFTPQPDIPMTNSGGAVWEADIPGQPGGTIVNYRVFATDMVGASSTSGSRTYEVLTLNSIYFVDTGYACVPHDIRATGTTIDTGKFFEPPFTAHGTAPKDDGTAGPFDMGGTMTFFFDTLRYAWVGVNGGVGLSKSPTDTQDVNSNGFYAHFTFPSVQKTVRNDSTTGYMPPNFIAPMWADLIIGDTAGNEYGRIVYQAEPCLFTVEWDSVGAFFTTGAQQDNTTFRVIFNKCDGTIEYQYTDIGTNGEDSTCTVGMQGDSTAARPGTLWMNVNDYVYPYETKPRANWCMKFYPGTPSFANAGWNMLSLGRQPFDYHKAAAYPLATSSAFAYQGGYVVTDPLSNGPGYWLKFAENAYAGAPGRTVDSVSIAVTKGWNMIGSASHPVATGSVVKNPAGAHLSNYFGYSGSGYTIISTIKPGFGYWVKTDSNGSLSLPSSVATPKTEAQTLDLAQLNRVTVTDRNGRSQTLYLADQSLVNQPADAFQMPPAAPEFDARFSDGRILETYPSNLENDKSYQYPISIQTDAYPIVVRWSIVHPSQVKMVLNAGTKMLSVMEGTGSAKISDKTVKTVTVGLGGAAGVPTRFALGQNYPNPFNPSTHFTVDVPRATDVEVAVFDVLGQKIATLVTGEVGAGSYQITWDGRDSRGLTAPTGIYFVRMSADQFSATRKIMMMK